MRIVHLLDPLGKRLFLLGAALQHQDHVLHWQAVAH